MNLLVVEDDDKIGSFVARGLEQEGHHVEWTKDGNEGLARARTGSHDVVVVDLMLPGRSDLELIEELRAARVRVPLLVLSAKSSVADRVRGLESGADDYLTKPFSFAELVARINALSRRASEKIMPAPTALEYEDLKLDLLSRRATRGSREIPLQSKEFALLEYFLRNPERVGNRVVLEVKDTGAGISPDEQRRIFDRLYRGDRSRSEPGLGLGLSFVRAIAHAHGGTVSVASAPGQGSSFTVSLPADGIPEGSSNS